MSKLKNIARFTSDVIMLLAITMSLPLIVALAKQELAAAVSFIETIALCTLVYFGVHIFVKKNDYLFKYRDGFVITTIIWFFLTVIGGLPYFLSGEVTNFFECMFESASGFTTTGSTIISDVEALPRS
ncbi:MAG: TrkH family potassium uptake protein, partial [Clostridia bacterium]|nr:TrkH family potassium uptake protein [Clostridia bacterium]